MRTYTLILTLLLVILVACGQPSEQATQPTANAEPAAEAPSAAPVSTSVGASNNLYWGDTHLHTAVSVDAGTMCRVGQEDAYRFARGEEVMTTHGLRAKLSRPLDFLVVADHSDNMGFFPDLFSGAPHLLKDPTGKRWFDMVQNGEGLEVAMEVIDSFSREEFPEALISASVDNTWHDSGEGVVGNWIGLVYQLTHRERSIPFMEGVDPNDPLGLRQL